MTVLVGLVRPDGVGVVADRGAVYDGRFLAPGMPWPAPDRTKILASGTAATPAPGAAGAGGGLVGGLAGKATSPNVDLFAEVQRVLDEESRALVAADRIAELFDSAAGRDLGDHAGLTPAAASPFGVPVVTVALVGGRRGDGFTLAAVGLPAAGRARVTELHESVVFALASVQADAELMLLNQDPADPLAVAAGQWCSNMASLAQLAIVRQQVDITTDCDYALVGTGGWSGVRRHTPPPTPPAWDAMR